jgi:hypothetical protein
VGAVEDGKVGEVGEGGAGQPDGALIPGADRSNGV